MHPLSSTVYYDQGQVEAASKLLHKILQAHQYNPLDKLLLVA